MEGKSENEVKALKAHVSLNVKNVEESIDFYRRMLGIEPSKVRRGYAKFDVQNPPLNFTLNEGHVSERGALSHLGIQVGSTEDVLAIRQKWAESGLITRDEMQTNCCYATQDKTWVRDPDGNEWEVFVVLKDNLPDAAACDCGEKVTTITSASVNAGETGSCCAPTSGGVTHESSAAEARCC